MKIFSNIIGKEIHYFLSVFIAIVVSILGGSVTITQMDWYSTLVLPEITPEGAVFGKVWTVLYILTVISAILFFNRTKKKRLVAELFLLNAVLNLCWSIFFFGNHQILVALIDAVLLEISILLLIWKTWPTSKISAVLLYPYAIWVIFACYLNYMILILN